MAVHNRLTLNVGNEIATIDKNIYGHFAEHLGRCIYDGFWVGRDSSIPNINGVRRDVLEALRMIHPPVLRWPGGCFAEEYHWRDGVGPTSTRKKRVNTYWGGVVDDNTFGTHEFFELCELLGAEPYVCGNVSTGTPTEMQEWLEYMNCPESTELTELRKQNGAERPFGLKYFGVGNENWGCGGRMRAEYYADVYRRYQNHAKSYSADPLFKIACGPKNDDYHWTDVLMREAAEYMDGLALHYYTRFFSSGENKTERRGSATVFGEDEWFLALQKALYMEELVQKHSEIMDRYDPEKRVALVVDEWGTWFDVEPGTNPHFLFQQNTIRDALVAGINLNIFNNHAERVRMANIAQTVNVLQAMILTEGERMVLTPSYHVFAMYQAHQGARLLESRLECEDYRYGRDRIPAVSSSASVGSDGRITVSLCNVSPHDSVKLQCDVRGDDFTKIEGSVLKGSAMDEHNTFDSPDRIRPVHLDTCGKTQDGFEVELAPMSVTVLSLSH